MALLVAGCGLGGVAVGVILDRFAAPLALTRTAPAAGSPSGSPQSGDELHGSPQSGDGSVVRAPVRPAPVAQSVVVALGTGALCALAAHHFGAVPVLAAYAVLFAGLVSLSAIDLRVRLVPRPILYPLAGLVAVALVAAAAADGHWRPLGDAAIGGALALAVFFAIWWVYPSGMGLGDVRLAALLGLGLGWLGLFHVYIGFVIGLVAGTVFGMALMVLRGTGRKTRMPLVPSLSLGAVIGVVWGSQIINAWFPGHH
jgi:leader peptidase (prepilin peptidase)/N-methyltransferase